MDNNIGLRKEKKKKFTDNITGSKTANQNLIVKETSPARRVGTTTQSAPITLGPTPYFKCAHFIYHSDSDAFSYRIALCSSPSFPSASRSPRNSLFHLSIPGLVPLRRHPRTIQCARDSDSATYAPRPVSI